MNNIVFAPLSKQIEFVINVLSKNQVLSKTLQSVKKCNLPDWYIAAGAISQTIWNFFHDFDLNYGIDDFDIVYFDNDDLSKETEKEIEKKLQKECSECPVRLEVVNEARAHLWYKEDYSAEIEPYTCIEEAIYRFPTTASAVGITLNQNNQVEIFAPHGLGDLLSLIVRANKIQVPKRVYEEKCQRWKKVWPKLTIIPWGN